MLVSQRPTPVAARSKAWVCGRSLVGTAGSNPAGGNGCLFLLSVVCCQVVANAFGGDHLSGGVLPSVMCLSVIAKPR